MSNADTALPRSVQQPTLPRRPLGAVVPETAVVEIIDYLRTQQETIARMWDLLVEIVSERHGVGVIANRPSPGVKGRFYMNTDAPKKLSIDDGAAWEEMTIP